MLSSLASFFFGSKATNEQLNPNEVNLERFEVRSEQVLGADAALEHTIEVTRSTPSVTGSNVYCAGASCGGGAVARQTKRQSRRNRNNNCAKDKHQTGAVGGAAAAGQEQSPSIVKLLNPSGHGIGINDTILDDDWLIIDKEDENLSLPRTDSEKELSIVEVKPTIASSVTGAYSAAPGHQRRRQHINSHSLYSGPRPQQHRNLQQRLRNGGTRVGGAGAVGVDFIMTPLNFPRSIASCIVGADGGITQSLYAVGSGRRGGGGDSATIPGTMEESWYVTPPPCFTSIGPINIEVSPFENLLIEHPSMSVYHSIRSAQEATECFVNLDLGVDESKQTPSAQNQTHLQAQIHIQVPLQNNVTGVAGAPHDTAEGGIANARSRSAPIDQFSAYQLKQELLARTAQKNNIRRERQSLCRSAIARQNKVRDSQSKGQRQRRADMQHCRIVSGANNNRKCKF